MERGAPALKGCSHPNEIPERVGNEILHRVAAYFAKEVLELPDDGFPVALTGGALGFSRQSFY